MNIAALRRMKLRHPEPVFITKEMAEYNTPIVSSRANYEGWIRTYQDECVELIRKPGAGHDTLYLHHAHFFIVVREE